MVDSAAPARPRPSALAGVFLVAGSVLLVEVTLTRVFAIQLWHHLTYMVVSIAMLGLGAAGSLLTARPELVERGDARRVAASVARPALLYGFAAMLAIAFVTSVRVDSLRLWQEPRNFFALLLIYALLIAPFLLGGLSIGRALATWTRDVHRVYFADLTGSAIGALGSVLLLDRIGPAETVFVGGAVGVLGGSLLALGAGGRMRIAGIAASVPALVVAACFLGGVPALSLPPATWPVPFAPNKEVVRFDASTLAARLPSPVAEVEVSVPVEMPPSMGGNFGVIDRYPVRQRVVAQDGTAPTILVLDAADLEKHRFLDDSQAASGYVALAAQGRRPENVCVIGVGGGVDVMMALYHGARRVDAAEVNSAMVRLVREVFDEELGGLFREEDGPFAGRVFLHHAEGRSFVRHHDRTYDLIQLSGVDSFTALSTGAYTLSESYLYTVEAVREFYRHLAPGGLVNYSRFLLTEPRRPRETLRLALIAREALELEGVADPARSIAVFAGANWASTMIRKGPFQEAEIEALRAFAEREAFRGLVFDPLAPPGAPFGLPGDAVWAAKRLFGDRLARFTGREPAKVAPAADLLVEALEARLRGEDERAEDAVGRALERLGPDAGIARQTLGALLEEAQRAGRAPIEGFHRTRSDFHRLLEADAAERDRLVAEYPYAIDPVTDDRPFFFNYYKWRGLLGPAGRLEEQSHYHYDYPVGHAVLLASIVQIALFGFFLLVAPLLRLRRRAERTPHAAQWFGYFAALGLGFLFVEIALMQKLVLFLGHPTLALSVVLAGMLAFAGLGAGLSVRYDLGLGRDRIRLALFCGGAIALATLLSDLVLPALLGLPQALRLAIALLVLAPVGLALGAPFPAGLRLLEREAPHLVPWAWAANGFLSVLSSLLAVVVAMAAGFRAVLLLAAAIYLLGFLCLPRAASPASAPSAS